MKITILLCSLVTIVTAVPIDDQGNYHERDSTSDNLFDTINREKKSPFLDHGVRSSFEARIEDTQDGSKSVSRLSPMEERTFGFKKPIIIKKKIGYHLYRDSDEEMAHADPHENCRKQVKVKLCDDEPGSSKHALSCLPSERLNEDSEKEIENSIKTAKEAVENLQRDLHKIEHNSAKMANIEDKDLEDDFEVHENIEAARKALEHIQQNFGNLETLNLQVTAPKTEDFQSKSSDEERLAQWKEAIDNIQKNFVIVRNIEDAFKAESEQTNLLTTDLSNLSKTRDSDLTERNDDLHTSNTANSSKLESISDETDAIKKLSEDSHDDMFTSPTVQQELKIKLHSDSLRSEKMPTRDETVRSNEHTDESLGDHKSIAMDTYKSHNQLQTMKNSEFTLMSEETLEPGSFKSDSHQEIGDHVRKQEAKTVKDNENDSLKNVESNALNLSENEDANPLINKHSNLKTIDNLNSPKSAESMVNSEKMKQHGHGMLVESSDINSQQNQMGAKYNRENSVATRTSLLDGEAFEEMEKSQPGKNNIDEHDTHERMEFKNNDVNEQQILNDAFTMRFAHEKIKSPTTEEIRFSNKQQNFDEHTVMRMINDANMNYQQDPPIMRSEHLSEPDTPMQPFKTTSKFHNEATQIKTGGRNNEQHTALEHSGMIKASDTHTKLDDFNIGQHFHNEHMNMRLSQDQNIRHHVNDNHNLQDPLLMHWAHENRQNDLSEFHNEQNMMPINNGVFNSKPNMFDEHNSMRMIQQNMRNKMNDDLVTAQSRFANNFDLANSHEFSQFGPRMHDMHTAQHVMAPDMDRSINPSRHMNMRTSSGKSLLEHNDMHWNRHHHHAMARYGPSLPITGGPPGAVGVFPNANTGCGIPLMLSCSPSVVSGSLAKTHPAAITAPAYRSGDDLMFYMKRDAKENDLPAIKIQKSSLPFNHKPELVFDKTK